MTQNEIFEISPVTARWADSIIIKILDNPTLILHRICEYFKVDETILKSHTRRREVVYPRHVCMYIMCYNTRLSLKEIGEIFSSRDHTTVIHARDTIKDLIDVDARVCLDVYHVKNMTVPVRAEITKIPTVKKMPVRKELKVIPAPIKLPPVVIEEPVKEPLVRPAAIYSNRSYQ